MTADEILKALEESEGFYLEVGAWVITPAEDDEFGEGFAALRYKDLGRVTESEHFCTLYGALNYALKDGKP